MVLPRDSSEIPAVDYIDNDLSKDSQGYHEGILLIIRAMLLASQDDVNAAVNATRQVREYYHDKSLEAGCPWKNQEDHSIPWFLSAAADITFDVASHVPVSDFRHDRLVDFLVGFKEQASEAFDPEDPQLTWYQSAYSGTVVEYGKPRYSSQAELIETTANEDEAKKACDERINFSSLAARLIAKEVLTSVEVERFAQEIIDGLQGCKSDRQPPQLLLSFRAVVAARHLILAGQVFVREARSPTTSRGADLLSSNRWKAWTSKLEELETTGSSDAPWPVRTLAGKALVGIRELYPEVIVAS